MMTTTLRAGLGALAFSAIVMAGCGDETGSSAWATLNTPPASGATAHVRDDDAAQAVPTVPQTATGTWYLSLAGGRMVVDVSTTDGRSLVGAARAEGDSTRHTLVGCAWDAARATLSFHHAIEGGFLWYQGVVAGGVLHGRAARTADERAPAQDDYAAHLTGWNARVVDASLTPRVFDLRQSDGAWARLRIDRTEAGELVGRYKVYGRAGIGALGESPEYDLSDITWDGSSLAFSLVVDEKRWTYRGAVDGRSVHGDAYPTDASSTITWDGARAEVLSHGLAAHPRVETRTWSDETRAALRAMMMDGAPAPDGVHARLLADGIAPTPFLTPGGTSPAQPYTLAELVLDLTIPEPRGGAGVASRSVHVWVSHPTTTRPERGYPVAIALNGHWGSARQVMNPNTSYGYGDEYASRGYVVVAVDVSHRPFSDRAALYTDITAGDDASTGNGPHAAIRYGARDSDWEEDGERAWDVMRAIDYAVALPDVDRSRVTVTGLSMGAEVATVVGALDPRVTSVVAAGFAPDLNVMRLRSNHSCWRWTSADISEYIDVSDLHALIAPRLLVVETGLVDRSFSDFRAPYASDKQVLRRSRPAWTGAQGRVLHFLHGGGHVYRVGDPDFDATATRGITIPVAIEPAAPGSVDWQTDSATTIQPRSIFDLTRSGLSR